MRTRLKEGDASHYEDIEIPWPLFRYERGSENSRGALQVRMPLPAHQGWPYHDRFTTISTDSHMTIRVILLLVLLNLTTAAHADCFSEAASYQHVNEMILRALAWQESHNNGNAKHINTNGSIDYGLMQINSIHLSVLSAYGITSRTLMDPCASIYIAAWHLRKMMLKYGNTWRAVGAYHSQTPAERDRYAMQVRMIVRRMQ